MKKTTKKNYSFCHMGKSAEEGKYFISFDGRLTADPEMKSYSNGEMAKFSVALNNVHKTINRVLESVIVKEDETTFLNCTAFGYGADSVKKALKKGDLAVFGGEATINEYNGKKYLNVTIDKFEVITRAARNESATETVAEESSEVNEDLPF